MSDLKDNVKFTDEDTVEIYGKRYSGEVFRHFDIGTDENTFIQIISKKDDDLVILKTIKLDYIDVNEILKDLKARAQQAIEEFEGDEEFELSQLDDNINALKLMLKVNADNTDSE